MQKYLTTTLSLTLVSVLANAADSAGTISAKTEHIKNNEVVAKTIETTKSADLAETLSKSSPDISFKRTTGSGQDLFVRSFGYEDVNIEIDGTKLYGACPNHMDPPLAHISPVEVEDISVVRGPFDVSSFGNLGAKVDVKTATAKEGIHGDINGKYGSYNYQDYAGKLSFGSKHIDIEGGGGYASQKPYKDGSGQNIVNAKSSPAYKSGTDDEELYKTYGYYLKTKLKPVDSVEVGLNGAVHKTDQALYPGKAMDGVKDDTTRVGGSIALLDLGSVSDRVELSLYANKVDHDMDNHTFRVVPLASRATTVTTSDTKGFGVSSQKSYKSFNLEYGVNGYSRKHKADMQLVSTGRTMQMLDGEVADIGGYVDAKIPLDHSILLSAGLRYDGLSFKNNASNVAALKAVHGNYDSSRNKGAFGGYVKLDKYFADTQKAFLGVGVTNRAPTPVELYIVAQNGTWVGNPNLNPVQNSEIDGGYTYDGEQYLFEVSAYYSMLNDYIYPVATKVMNVNRKTYQNIDATMYGGLVGGGIRLTKTLSAKSGVAYQVGTKNSGSDRDLIDIPPLKVITSLEYDDGMMDGKLEWIAAATQTKVDSSLNQQEVAGWGIVNISGGYTPMEGLSIDVGVENVFNQNYALSTSYDINPLNPTTYIVNEPGRTFFIAGNYKF